MQPPEPRSESRVVHLTDNAKDIFDVWWVRQQIKCQNAPSGLKNHFGKYPGYTLRLAMVLEHLWWCIDDDSPKPTTISEAAILAGIRLVDEYFGPMAERVYGDAETPEIERNETTLANWIIKNKPHTVNSRVLRRDVRLPGMREANVVDATLDALVDSGWLITAPTRQGETPGRSRKDYNVDPRVYQAVN